MQIHGRKEHSCNTFKYFVIVIDYLTRTVLLSVKISMVTKKGHKGYKAYYSPLLLFILGGVSYNFVISVHSRFSAAKWVFDQKKLII